MIHESSRFKDSPPEPKRLKPEYIKLPAHLPYLPEIRKDFARYHERVTGMASEEGKILDKLEKAVLADNYYCHLHLRSRRDSSSRETLREETGVKIPMVVRVPE